MFPKKVMYLLFGVLILPLAACTAINDTIPMPGGASAEASLANTRWRLVSYGRPGSENPVMEGTEVILQFKDGSQVGGFAGCNTFGAKYEVSDGNKLSITDIVSRRMACTDEGFMEEETQYFDALRFAESFELLGDSLMIHYGGSVLNFSRVIPSTPSTVHI